MMNDMEDEKLKHAFARLKDYDSPQKGVSWRTLRLKLDGSEGWSKTAVTCILLVFIAIAPAGVALKGAKENLEQLEATSGDAPRALVALDHRPAKLSALEQQKMTNLRTEASEIGISSENEAPSAEMPSIERPVEGLSLTVPGEVDEKMIQMNDLEYLDELPALESSLSSRRPASARKTVGLSFLVSGFYTMGLVNPLLSDNVVLDKYHSKPGYGFKIGVQTPLLRRGRRVIETGVQYMMMKKDFDYDFLIYNPELSTPASLKTSLPLHYLGWMIQVRQNNWVLGATYFDVLTKDQSTEINGRDLVMLHISKEVPLRLSGAALFFKTSTGFPLRGPFQVFKYRPIQFEMGLRINTTMSKRKR